MTKLEDVTEAIIRVDRTINGIGYPQARDFARAAIDAMREPTDEMIDAGGYLGFCHIEDCAPIYRVMIKATLNEKPE